MKILLSILLGPMLLTSLVGISYATPIVQLTQNTGGDNCAQLLPSNPSYNVTVTCHGDSNHGSPDDPPSNSCLGGQKADFACCSDGITPHSPEVSDIQPDPTTCSG